MTFELIVRRVLCLVSLLVTLVTLALQAVIAEESITTIPSTFPSAFPSKGNAEPIIKGLPTAVSEQPWMVALVRQNAVNDIPPSRLQFCGGTLIAAEWILTAAHCVQKIGVAEIGAIIGAENLDASGVNIVDIEQIVVHPNYGSRSLVNDVALLRLATPSPLKTIPLAHRIEHASLSAMIARVYGWGQTYIEDTECTVTILGPEDFARTPECKLLDLSPGSRPVQAELLQLNIGMLDETGCKARIKALLESLDIEPGDGEILQAGQICAFDPREQAGICFGDSGGPLLVERNGVLEQIGIASFIYGAGGCARALATDVFTNMAFVAEFIAEVVNSDYSLSFENYCPQTPVVEVTYDKLDAEFVQVNLLWEGSMEATGYTLRYRDATRSGQVIQSVQLDRADTSVSATLPIAASFQVTLQAYSATCSSAQSDILDVGLPAT